jgi:hypothetical protein
VTDPKRHRNRYREDQRRRREFKRRRQTLQQVRQHRLAGGE